MKVDLQVFLRKKTLLFCYEVRWTNSIAGDFKDIHGLLLGYDEKRTSGKPKRCQAEFRRKRLG
jgi:hypothetical protein